MTPQEREQQIRERCAAATPWPHRSTSPGELGRAENWHDFLHRTDDTFRYEDVVFFNNAPADVAYLLARVAQIEAALQSILDYDPGTRKVDLMNAGMAANAYRVASVALATMPDTKEGE